MTTSGELARDVERRVDGWAQVRVEVVGSLGEALARVDEYAPEHLELHLADPDAFAAQVRNAGSIFLGATTPAVVGDYAAGANHVLPTGGLARAAGGLGLEAFLKPVQIVAVDAGGARSDAGDGGGAGRGRGPAAARGRRRGTVPMIAARPLPEGFEAYIWARQADEVAAAHGLAPAEVLRFDANVPALPGVPAVPVGESFAALNEYPEGTYRELREAAAAYAGVEPDEIVIGAGADDLIGLVAQDVPRAGPPRGDSAADLSALCDRERYRGRRDRRRAARALGARRRRRGLGLQPGQPDRRARRAGGARRRSQPRLPGRDRRSRRGVLRVRGANGRARSSRGQPNLIAIRSLSKAFGFAALRVGYAIASREVAAELDRRRAPAPVSTVAARIAAAALRDPVLDVESEVAERERMRDALLAAGFECPPSHANFVYVPVEDGPELADRLDAQGLVVRRYADAIRITPRLPAENDRLLAALGAGPVPASVRSALVVRTSAETALRVSLALDGRRRARVQTGVGFLDHLLAQLAFHGGLDLDVVAGGDVGVDEHHTVEDVMAALGGALARRARVA